MTITQRLAALTGGVSQRPQSQRGSGQAEAQTNALNHPVRGLMKRPPSEHLAQLSVNVAGLDTGFTHDINLSSTEQFLAVVREGAIEVYDKSNGDEVAVDVAAVDSYLSPLVEDVAAGDPFTEVTDLVTMQTHVSPAGVVWTQWLGGGYYSNIVSNRLKIQRIGVGTKEGYFWPETPPTADYIVEATVRRNATGDQHRVGVMARAIAGMGGYVAYIDGLNSGSVRLGTMNAAGTITAVTSVTTQNYVVETDYRLKLVLTGTTIRVYVDDVLKIEVTNATFSAAGNAGIYGEGSLTGGSPGQFTYIDNFAFTYTPEFVAVRPPIKAVQVGNQSIIANTTIPVRRGSKASPNKVHQALVAILQADYGTQYNLTLDGQEITLGSPEGVTPQARDEIDTTTMAAKLKNLIESISTLNAFTVSLYGSSLLLAKSDGSDFTITTDDGLADNGLVAVKGSVQSFADLPAKGPDGFVVEVAGDVSNQFDNYFVRFDVTDTATSAGVWKECVKPGEVIELDRETLPHVLTYKGSYTPKSQAAGTPPSPTIVPGGGTSETDKWDEASIFGRIALDTENDQVHATLAAANGISTEYTVWFDVDTRDMDQNAVPTLTLAYETAPDTWTEAATRTFGPSVFLKDESITATMTLVAGQRIRLRLNYADGTPPKRGFFYTATHHIISEIFRDAITFEARTGKSITFNPTTVYPQGALIRITVDGANFDYTPATDVTGAVVATTLKATIDADVDYVATNPASGQILVVRADAADLTVSYAITWSEATSYHDPDLALTDGALVGKTIRNLTDGSEGEVTANTETTITVASITGGIDNTFQKDDRIEVVGSGSYFTFSPAAWADREVGDLTSNPLPALVDQKINDVLITKGRLGFVSGGNILLSEVGNLFNLFRTTVTQLLDGDPIDVKPAHGEAVQFHSYSAWDGRDIFWSSRHQFELSGEPLLSPKTVKLLPISEYPMDTVRPIVLGRYAYFVAAREGYTQVYQYGVMENQDTPQAVRLTRDVPLYIAGNTLAIAGDEELGMFVVLTDADRSQLYVHTFDRELKHEAWTRWQFPAGTSLVDANFSDGVLTVLSEQSDGLYIDTMNITTEADQTYLDRRHTSVGVYSNPNTTWTLPFSCAADGSEGTVVVYNTATGAALTTTRPSATTVRATGDYSATDVLIGIQYTFSHTFSTIFPRRGEEQTALIDGRLQLSRLRINYEDTRSFTVTTTPFGRAARSKSVDESAATDGTLVMPVLCRNKDATITITNNQPTQLRITDAEWEGTLYSRSKRL